jgi:hypothetical protein
MTKIAVCSNPCIYVYLIERSLIFDIDIDNISTREINKFENGRQVIIYNSKFFNRFGVGVHSRDARDDLIRSIKLYLESLSENRQLIAFLRKKGFYFETMLTENTPQKEIRLIDSAKALVEPS